MRFSTLALFVSLFSRAAPEDNCAVPVTLLKGEGNLIDTMNNFNGTTTSSMLYQTGYNGSQAFALNFFRTGWVGMPSGLSSIFGGSYALAAWIKLSGRLSGRDPITVGSGDYLEIKIASPIKVFINETPYIVSNVPLPENNWVHVALVYDSSSEIMTTYYNGIVDKNTSVPPYTGENFEIQVFSEISDNGEIPKYDLIDEVAYFNTSLTADDVNYIVNNGVCTEEPSVVEADAVSSSSSVVLSNDTFAAEFVKYVAFNASESLVELQLIEGKSGSTNVTLYEVDDTIEANETNCANESLAQNAQIVQNGAFDEITPGTNSNLVRVGVELNLTGIEESNLYHGINDETGKIMFCAKADNYAEGIGSVTFTELIVTLYVNLTAGFQIDVDDVLRSDPTEQETDASFEVDAFICDDGYAKVSSPILEQNSAFNLCIFPKASGLKVEKVNVVEMTQDGTIKFSPVQGGVAVPQLSSLDPQEKGMVLKSRVISAFFEDTTNPSSIYFSGSVELAFDESPARRALEENVFGAKTDDDTPLASFELSVELKPLMDVESSIPQDESDGDQKSDVTVEENDEDETNERDNNAESGVSVNVIIAAVGGIVGSVLLVLGFRHSRARSDKGVVVKYDNVGNSV